MLNVLQETTESGKDSASKGLNMEVFVQGLIDKVPDLLMALVILIIGWIISKWVFRMIASLGKRRSLDPALMRFLGGIAQYGVLTAAVISALGRLGVETASLVAIFASAGLAVGLALQGSLSNFASGVMILLFRPFTLSDKVKIAGETGVIKDIGIFSTTMLTPGNERIIIPNSKIMGDVITNYTVEGTLRAGVDVGVGYGADVNKVRELLLKSAQRMELALQDPEPAVFFGGLGASSLDFKVFAWADTANFFPLQDALRQAVYDDLNEAGIEIPFNQIVVHRAEES